MEVQMHVCPEDECSRTNWGQSVGRQSWKQDVACQTFGKKTYVQWTSQYRTSSVFGQAALVPFPAHSDFGRCPKSECLELKLNSPVGIPNQFGRISSVFRHPLYFKFSSIRKNRKNEVLICEQCDKIPKQKVNIKGTRNIKIVIWPHWSNVF